MKQPIDDYIEEMKEQFYEQGTLYASTYDILERHGKIKVSDDEIMRYVRQARLQIKAELNQSERIELKNKPAMLDERISNEAKKIAVGALFSKMKLREKT